MKSPRVVLYLRVSTAAQGFAAQRSAVLAYCRRRGWRPLKVYQEKKSGVDAQRTELDALLRAARADEFDVLVIYKLDRLGRSTIHLAQIVNELTALRIGFVSATEGIDTTAENPMARFTIEILQAVAALDRDRIRERSADGLKAARARGVTLGRPRLDPERKLAIQTFALEHDKYGRRSRTVRDIAKAAAVSVGTAAPLVRAARQAARAKEDGK